MGLDYTVPREEPRCHSPYVDKIGALRREIREDALPYFEDDELTYYLEKHHGDVDAAAYEMLILKSEDSTIVLTGMTTQDTSDYFKRLASRKKRYNSQTLRG